MRILVINQYFPPDRAATAQLLGQLCTDLLPSFDIKVICGSPTYAPDAHAPDQLQNRNVIRIPLLKKGRANLFGRILNYAFFLIGATFTALTSPRYDVVMCWTDPPLVGVIGGLVKWVKGSRFVFVSQDVYPDVARASKKMNDPFSLFILGWASRHILKSADAIVVLGEAMKQKIVAKGPPVSKVRVIPNWQDLSRLHPAPKEVLRTERGIPHDQFVVMHSGNIGFSQDLESLLEAARILKLNREVVFVIVGEGARHEAIRRQVESERLFNVKLFPYADGGRLSESLSMADLHYVSLKPDFLGLIVPSKVYGILAVARPIIANVPEGCEVERIVNEAHCGILVGSGGKDFAEQIASYVFRARELEQMGRSGRSWIEANGGREWAVQKYRSLITEISAA